jgi:hypothetical protein
MIDPLRRIALGPGRKIWAGPSPPLGGWQAAPELLDPLVAHRCAAGIHGQCDVVGLLRVDLAREKWWRVIVDEAVRLLRDGGVLALRFSRSPLVSEFAMAHAIRQAASGRLQLVHSSWDGEYWTWAVEVARPSEPASTHGVAFGVITDGRRDAGAVSFAESVSALRGFDPRRHEVLVCGPPSSRAAFADAGIDVTWIDQPTEFANRGWITRKKNLIIEAARQENLMIAHDRYVVAPDFLEALEAWGGDFDALVCAQAAPDGGRFPDWVALGSDWSWATPIMLDWRDYAPTAYMNGGLLFAKTDLFQREPFNELLFWGEAEDVELSRRWQERGVVIRPAPPLRVQATDARPGFADGFERGPMLQGYVDAPKGLSRLSAPSMERVARSELGEHTTLRAALDDGVALPGDWVACPGGFETRSSTATLQLDLGPGSGRPRGIHLMLWREVTGSRPMLSGASVNGIPCPWTMADAVDGQIDLRIDLSDWTAFAGRTTVELHAPTTARIRVAAVRVERAAPLFLNAGGVLRAGAGYPGLRFGEGWAAAEAWGRWATHRRADVIFTLGSVRPSPMTLNLGLRRPLSEGARVAVLVDGAPLLMTGELGPGSHLLRAAWEPPPGVLSEVEVTVITSDLKCPDPFSDGDYRPLAVGLEYIALQVEPSVGADG